jgi:hypothetical protein
MRRLLLVTAAAVWLAAAPAALAAPTCQDAHGDAIRCATPGAMPVGWTLPAAQRQAAASSEPSLAVLVYLACFIGGLFALIALMPDFDGWNAGDWDEQEADREKPE